MSNIFFIRHENDLEFMLPIMVNDFNPFVVIYGKLLQESLVSLKNMNSVNLYKESKLIEISYRFINKITRGSLNRKLSIIYNDFLVRQAGRAFNDSLNTIPFNQCSNVVFDHLANDTVQVIVSKIKNYRKKNNLDFKILSIPHGVGAIVNSMTDYIHTKPVNLSGFDIFDLIICNDQQHFDQFKRAGIIPSKMLIISNLRYTKKWVSDLLENSKLHSKKNKKINILLIHTKFMGNINEKEVERCLKIIYEFNKFYVKIKSHPRGGLVEALNLRKKFKKVEVVTDDIVGNISWCDYVLFFGSSAVYDAFILNKAVLFPSYAVSNELCSEIMNGVICLNTPDDFYKALSKIAQGEKLKLDSNYEANFEDILSTWKNLLNRR